jgi:hypothetical protein
MKIFLTTILGAALLVLPAGAAAKPDHADKRAAIAQCKAERGKTKATHRAFKGTYHSFSRCVRQNTTEEAAEQRAARKNAAKQCKAERGSKSYGKCVSAKARELKAEEDAEDAQEVQAFKNAAKQCAAEEADENFAAGHGGKSFEEFYGTNKNKRNAFGKCVSGKSQRYVDPF